MLEARFSQLYFGPSLNTLQLELPAIASLLVFLGYKRSRVSESFSTLLAITITHLTTVTVILSLYKYNGGETLGLYCFD